MRRSLVAINMDGTTEPIIAVIAHPIAGNPSQFALERALRSVDLDWRVISFDVKPGDVAAALEGFLVTGIAGVMIDPSVRDEASSWYQKKSVEAAAAEPTTDVEEDDGEGAGETDESVNRQIIDCLSRNSDAMFAGSYQRRNWLDDRIKQHAGQNRVWLGQSLDNLPLSRNGFDPSPLALPPEPEKIRAAETIVIAPIEDDESALLECEEWPEDDGSTLIVDLTDGQRVEATLERLGYLVVTDLDRRIGTLQRCLHLWTGAECSGEVIHDAIEEYLGV